jgi:acetyl-CoA synthetase
MLNGGTVFIELRDLLLRKDLSHQQAIESCRWPEVSHFNWALDYFDRMASGNERPALHLVDDAASQARCWCSNRALRACT